MAYINIVKGDDTNFLGNQYLVVKFNTDMDLVGFKAIFKLGNIVLTYPDLTAKYVEIVLSKEVTSSLQKGKLYGTLQLIDTQDRVRTVTTVLPFNVVTKVIAASQISKNSIQLDLKIDKNELTIDMNIIGLSQVVAEGYLNQMKTCNAELDTKIAQIKSLEKSIEGLKQETQLLRDKAEEWAESDAVIGEEGHSSKYYADGAADMLNTATDVFEQSNQLLESAKVLVEDEALKKNQITNCLLEIPQNIKLDLTDGVLTLQAGSKVIVPNGFEENGTTPKFDEVTIENDITLTRGWGSVEQMFLFYRNGSLTRMSVGRSVSGSTDPYTDAMLHNWYDITNNIVRDINSEGAVENDYYSLPICIYTPAGADEEGNDTTTVTSIDQVFNGMGYMGSTIWVDKGVKGLIPNGRNTDGTLNNTEFTTPKVMTKTDSATYDRFIVFNADSLDNYLTADYDKEANFNIGSSGQSFSMCIAGKVSRVDGKVAELNLKKTFSAVDWSDIDFNKMDGQWVCSFKSMGTAMGTYSLADYLPDDGYNYDVKFRVQGYSDTDEYYVHCDTDIFIPRTTAGSQLRLMYGGSYSRQNIQIYEMPVGPGRSVTFSGTKGKTLYLEALGYRRIGTNV